MRIALLFLLLLLFSCSKPKPIKIGFLATLSGKNSELGIGARTGVRIAVEDINANGGINGRPLELVVIDDESSPEVGIRKLDSFAVEGVSIVVGPFTSNMKSVVDAGMKKNILFVSPTMSSSELSVANDLFVRVIPTCVDQSQLLVKDLTARNFKNILVLIDETNHAFSFDVWRWMETFASKNGTRERYQMDTLFLRQAGRPEQLARLVDSLKYDAVVVISNGIDYGIAAQHIKKNVSPVALYGARWSATPDLLINGGKAVEGARFTANIIYGKRSEKESRFFERFTRLQGSSPSFISLFSYDAVTLLATALRTSKTASEPARVRDALINGKTFEALQGTVTLDSAGDAYREKIELLTVKNGEIVRCELEN